MKPAAAQPHVFVNLGQPGLGESTAGEILSSLLGSGLAQRATELRISIPAALSHRLPPELEGAVRVYRDRRAVEVANLALRDAAREGAELLILDAAPAPEGDSLESLRGCLRVDPHFGFAVAREFGFARSLVRKLDPTLGDPSIDLIPREVIESGPPHYLARDHVGGCMLVSADVVRDFLPLADGFETLRGALLDLVARARRAGHRTVVSNRAFVDACGAGAEIANPEIQGRDDDRLRALNPDVERVRALWSALPVHEYEALLGRAASASVALRNTLLIDLSGLSASLNGTSSATLGILEGLHDILEGEPAGRDVAAGDDAGLRSRRAGAPHHWSVALLVEPEIAAAHDLARRFPAFAREWPAPHERYTASFRIVQPWCLDDLIRPHHLALFNFNMMYDVILDDIVIDPPHGVERVWSTMAERSDGLLYISDYTRKRMSQRFAVGPTVEEYVARLAMDPGAYRSAGTGSATGDAEAPYIFAVGNAYPHKWMQRTIDDLSTAFPFVRLEALGYQDPASARLVGHVSGDIPDAMVDRLYARASVIVFPSRYEGFGFPILQGLANDRTVIARESELLRELASHYRGPGRLVSFESSHDLVEVVGRALHDEPLPSLEFGSALAPGESPETWRDVANGILEFIEGRIAKPESSNWLRREAEIGRMELLAGRR